MANEVEDWLWKRALKAVKRYFRHMRFADTKTAQALKTVYEGYYRTGWIMGYRAGMRAKSSPQKGTEG